MTVLISKPSLNLREELAAVRANVKYQEQQFWFVGNGTLVAFTLPLGWKPNHVFNAGALQKEGSGDEYVASQVDGAYVVTFNTAPTNLNDVGVIGVRL